VARTVQCIKLGREAEGLDFPPYPGELGKRIYESVSKEAWAGWLKQQTMLVNENRLNLADQRAREYLKRQMENHFFGGGADTAAGLRADRAPAAWPPGPASAVAHPRHRLRPRA
jgi:Fe-S cluster biosynthesis and repair protein YggX